MPKIKQRRLSLGELSETKRLQDAYKARLTRSKGKEDKRWGMSLKPAQRAYMGVGRASDND